ncbi:hypothetical protein EG348_16845 [Chryseobacterium sp. G0201]|nr:hypothetical protein EG348_16845 [Chryseobacterium sp. G0201]
MASAGIHASASTKKSGIDNTFSKLSSVKITENKSSKKIKSMESKALQKQEDVAYTAFLLDCGYIVSIKTTKELSNEALVLMSIAFNNAFC